ncbi:hypothetical protein AB0R01_32100 [Streptomyces rochei]
MPSQRRTDKTAQRQNDGNFTPPDAVSNDSTTVEGERRRMWRVEVPAPKLPAIPTITAVGSGGGLTAAIATGHVQPGVVWPAVTLAIAGMAYDIAIRALNRPRQA